MNNEPLIIKRRGEDVNRIISVRIREEIVAKLDRPSAETNHSRNELINLILAQGVDNIEIQQTFRSQQTPPPITGGERLFSFYVFFAVFSPKG